MKLYFKRYFLLLFLYLLHNQSFAGDLKPVVIKDGAENQSIVKAGDIQVLYTSENEQLTFEQVVKADFEARFMEYDKEKSLFPEGNVVWVRFALTNQSKSAHWLIDLGTQYDSANLYIIDNQQVIRQYTEGSLLPITNRVKYYGFFSYLPLDIAPTTTQRYYLRLQIYKPISIQNRATLKFANNIVIQHEPTVASDQEQRKYFGSAFVAIYLIMAFYTFMLFLHFRDKSYLFFALLLFSSALTSLLPLDGLTMILGINRVQQSYFYFTLVILPWFFLLLFTRYYLRLRLYTPIWDKIVLGLLGLIGFYYLMALFNVWIVTLTIIISLLTIFVTFVVGVVVSAKGYRPAKYFLLANIFYLAGRLVGTLAVFYVINSKFLMLNASTIGGIFQIFLFAVGLLYRLEEMRKEIEAGKEEKQKMIETEKERLEIEVKARTLEIEHQKRTLNIKNEELLASEEELRQNMEELETNQEIIKYQRDNLEKTLEELESKNLRITDSIRYAKRIQNAILPNETELEKHFQDYFVIFKPKDVVSGDFYWFEEVQNKKFIAVVDCTGHGVPGAFMSMIGNTLLNEIINNNHVFAPNQILELLHLGIMGALNQQQNDYMQDGMDIALCCIEPQNETEFLVTFSGARRPVFYFSKGDLVEISGDKKSIGQGKNETVFQQHSFSLCKGDTIYLKTDGTKDIISPNNIRFGSNRFREIIKKSSFLPLNAQKELIVTQITDFQGNAEQRDDILIIGIKL